jgi:glycosyltransferase involved in cell wall biosynthesis
MRVVYLVHQYLPDHVGGTELYTHGLARRAVRAGHDVLVLTFRETTSNRPSDFVTRRREHEGVPVVELTHNLGAARNIALAEYDNAEPAAWVARQLAAWKPDVTHVTHAMKFGVGAIDASRDLDVPVVVTLTDFWFLCPRHTLLTWQGRLCDGPNDWRECLACVRDLHGISGRRREAVAVRGRPARMHRALATADRVIALSLDLLRHFEANGFDVDAFELVPHGLEPDAIGSPLSDRRPGPTRFVFIGNLVPFKGVHVVLDALASKPELDVELVLYGDGPEREALRRQSSADPRVTLAGTFAPAKLGAVVGDADYLVMPSLWFENEPLVVKAALHLGVPVIASRLGSLIDLVTDDIDGWTVPCGDVEEWAAALARADATREVWPRNGRAQPTMDDTYARVEAIYREVIHCPL